MPFFEYLCSDCGQPFEKIVPRDDSQSELRPCDSKNVEEATICVCAAQLGSS